MLISFRLYIENIKSQEVFFNNINIDFNIIDIEGKGRGEKGEGVVFVLKVR